MQYEVKYNIFRKTNNFFKPFSIFVLTLFSCLNLSAVAQEDIETIQESLTVNHENGLLSFHYCGSRAVIEGCEIFSLTVEEAESTIERAQQNLRLTGGAVLAGIAGLAAVAEASGIGVNKLVGLATANSYYVESLGKNLGRRGRLLVIVAASAITGLTLLDNYNEVASKEQAVEDAIKTNNYIVLEIGSESRDRFLRIIEFYGAH